MVEEKFVSKIKISERKRIFRARLGTIHFYIQIYIHRMYISNRIHLVYIHWIFGRLKSGKYTYCIHCMYIFKLYILHIHTWCVFHLPIQSVLASPFFKNKLEADEKSYDHRLGVGRANSVDIYTYTYIHPFAKKNEKYTYSIHCMYIENLYTVFLYIHCMYNFLNVSIHTLYV